MNEGIRRSILLVEDEENCRIVMRDLLEELGYEVFAAGDGQEALETFIAKGPAVVITDMRMPRMDGQTLFRKIRKKAPRTRVILVTAQATLDAATQLMKEGAVDYLAKPVDPKRLAATIEGAFASLERGDAFSPSEFGTWQRQLEQAFKEQVDHYKRLASKREEAFEKTRALVAQVDTHIASLEEELAQVKSEQQSTDDETSVQLGHLADAIRRKDDELSKSRADLAALKARLVEELAVHVSDQTVVAVKRNVDSAFLLAGQLFAVTDDESPARNLAGQLMGKLDETLTLLGKAKPNDG